MAVGCWCLLGVVVVIFVGVVDLLFGLGLLSGF